MAFVIFGVVALVWSAAVMRWLLPFRRARARRIFIAVSCATMIAAAVSLAQDVRVARVAVDSRASDLHVDVIAHRGWWELVYRRGAIAFASADELHVPAGAAVDVRWTAVSSPWLERGACRPLPGGRSILVVDRSTSARFVRLWRPMWRDLRIVTHDRDDFEAWFRNQTLPADARSGAGPFLFVNSGCGYCHVIRGVTESPEVVAPDLTHFAAHRTIAGTSFPIRRGQLTGWVVHSRGLLRQSEMPDNAVNPETLQPLVTYLESLR